jgi:hypothetical protein
MNGHEIAIDRATPKDEGKAPPAAAAEAILRPAAASAAGPRRSFDNGAGIVGPGLLPVFGYGGAAAANAAAAAGLLSAAADAYGAVVHQQQHQHNPHHQHHAPHHEGLPDLARAFEDLSCGATAAGLGSPHFGGMGGMGAPDHLPKRASAPGDAFNLLGGFGNMTTSAALQNLAKAQAALGPFGIGMGMGMGLPGLGMGMGLDMPQLFGGAGGYGGERLFGSFGGRAFGVLLSVPHSSRQPTHHSDTLPPTFKNQPTISPDGVYKPPMVPQQPTKGMDLPPPNQPGGGGGGAGGPQARHGDNPVITHARAGPRIFVGKLTKDTTEADVKEYFSRWVWDWVWLAGWLVGCCSMQVAGPCLFARRLKT